MANRLLMGHEAKLTTARHGKRGFVRIHTDVTPEMKTRLVAQAEKNHLYFADIVRDALDFYLDAVESV